MGCGVWARSRQEEALTHPLRAPHCSVCRSIRTDQLPARDPPSRLTSRQRPRSAPQRRYALLCASVCQHVQERFPPSGTPSRGQPPDANLIFWSFHSVNCDWK